MGIINYLTMHKKWGVRRGDLVLDIGSGNNPILRADLLVDRYIAMDTERYSGIVIDRPIINADGEYLPFKEKSIDFIYCSHVLEHIPNPAAFLSELSRVGKRGLIVTPNGDYEKLDPRKFHLWYVWNKDNILLLKQKHEWNEYPESSGFFFEITASPGYDRFYSKNFALFNTIYLWEDRIQFKIIQDKEFDYSNFSMGFSMEEKDMNKIPKSIPLKFHLKSFISRLLRPIIR